MRIERDGDRLAFIYLSPGEFANVREVTPLFSERTDRDDVWNDAMSATLTEIFDEEMTDDTKWLEIMLGHLRSSAEQFTGAHDADPWVWQILHENEE